MEKKHSTKRRPKEQYDAVIKESLTETNMMVISKKFGIPWTTVRGWIKETRRNSPNSNNIPDLDSDEKLVKYIKENIGINEYSYMLGCYFGDGWITNYKNKITKTFYLATGTNTPKLIDFQSKLMTLFGNKVVVKKHKEANSVYMYTNNSFIDKLFPHTGLGAKHDRVIQLTQWQENLINHKYVLLGLFHTDGCAVNVYKNKIRYEFINKSVDIINIYKQCCDKLNIEYTWRTRVTKIKKAPNKVYTSIIVVCRQKGSDKLLPLIGTKQEFSPQIFKDIDLTKIDDSKIRFVRYKLP